jgi:hypothetical protein
MTCRFLPAAVFVAGCAQISNALTVMPLGDSGTVGLDYYTRGETLT